MPFRSSAQRRWMFWKHPKMAKRWAKKTPKGKKLPERIGKKKKKRGNPNGYEIIRRRRPPKSPMPSKPVRRPGRVGVPIFPRPPRRKPRLPIPMLPRRPREETPFLRLEREAKEKVKRFRRKRLKKIPKPIPKIEEYDREIPRRKLFQVEFPIARPKRKRIPPRLI